MQIVYLIVISLISSTVLAQAKIDTIYNSKGIIEAYGELKNGRRFGVWYFNLKEGKSYKTINYLGNGEALVKFYSDEDLIWGVDQDAMRLFPSSTVENKKFYLSKYYNANYILENYRLTYHGLAHFYYPTTGTIMVGKFKDGNFDGEWISRYPSGLIMNRKHFEEGMLNGNWQTYYEGLPQQLWIEGKYHNNAKTGVWKEYYSNGQLKLEGRFNEDIKAIIITDNNIDSLQSIYKDEILEYYLSANLPFNFKSGIWNYYSDDGKLLKEEHFEEGIIIKNKK